MNRLTEVRCYCIPSVIMRFYTLALKITFDPHLSPCIPFPCVVSMVMYDLKLSFVNLYMHAYMHFDLYFLLPLSLPDCESNQSFKSKFMR